MSPRVLPVALLVLVILSSCWNPFAPTKGTLDGGVVLTLTEQRSPDEVLQNFRYAYIYRDSVVYSKLFDTSFVFIYYDDEIGGTGGYNYWGRDTELRTTGRLFKAFDQFTLVWNAVISRDTSDAGLITLTQTFDLSISGDIFLHGNAVFDFKSDDEGVWRITRWEDESFY